MNGHLNHRKFKSPDIPHPIEVRLTFQTVTPKLGGEHSSEPISARIRAGLNL